MKNKQLELKTEKTTQLKTLLKTYESLISEAFIQYNQERIKIIAADPAMVALGNLQIDKEFFQKYNVEEEGKIGVNIQGLYNAVRKSTKGDTITIEAGETLQGQDTLDENKVLKTTLEMEEGLWIEKKLPKLNLAEEDIPTVGELEYNNFFTINGESFKKYLNLVKNNATGIMFTVSEDSTLEFDAKVENSSLGTFKGGFNQENIEFTEEPVQSQVEISPSYLNKLIGGRLEKISEEIKVKQKEHHPISLTAETENIEAEFIIAPKIKEGEE
jgi:hypothetical protein